MWRSGFEGWRACLRDGGHGLRRFLVETKFADGALLEEGLRKELNVEWPEMRMSLPTRVVQDCLKLGRGMNLSTFVDRGWRRMSKRNPVSAECMR